MPLPVIIYSIFLMTVWAYDYLFYSLGYTPLLLLLLVLLLGLFHFLPLGTLSGWSLGPVDVIFLS